VSERPKPPPEAIEAAELALAEELRRLYPDHEVAVHKPGRQLPPGAVHLPAADEADREPPLERPCPVEPGGDGDPGDE
jgi:hypothetical protein